jgi:DNA-binding NarL/FixJ family response regulator
LKTPIKTGRKKVFVVDANPIVRFGIVQLIKGEKDLSVCGESDAGMASLAPIQTAKPDVVVTGVTFRRADGVELVKSLRQHLPQLPVVIMANYNEMIYADRAFRAGAKGYFELKEPAANLLKAIRSVLKGEVYLNDPLRSKMLNSTGNNGSNDCSPVESLTDRELEVFRLLGQGYNARQIAQEMCLSISTVETHRAKIKEKLRANTVGEVMKHAFHWTILEQISP